MGPRSQFTRQMLHIETLSLFSAELQKRSLVVFPSLEWSPSVRIIERAGEEKRSLNIFVNQNFLPTVSTSPLPPVTANDQIEDCNNRTRG